MQEEKRGKGPLTDLHRGTPRFAARNLVPQSATPHSREPHRQSHRAFPPKSTSKIYFKNTTPKPSHRAFPHVGTRIAGDGREGRKRGTGKEEQEKRNRKGTEIPKRTTPKCKRERTRSVRGKGHGVQEGKRGMHLLTYHRRPMVRFAARDLVPQSAPPHSREPHRQSHRAFPPVGTRIAGDEEEGRDKTDQVENP